MEKTDYIICYLDPTHDLLQQPLDLNISEGEEIVLYCSCNGHDGGDVTVYLTGYFIEEPVFEQNLDDLELTNDECSVSDLGSGTEEEEGEHRNLTRLLFQDSFVSDMSDEEFVVGGEKSVPALLPSNEEVSEESKSKESKKVSIDYSGFDSVVFGFGKAVDYFIPTNLFIETKEARKEKEGRRQVCRPDAIGVWEYPVTEEEKEEQ